MDGSVDVYDIRTDSTPQLVCSRSLHHQPVSLVKRLEYLVVTGSLDRTLTVRMQTARSCNYYLLIGVWIGFQDRSSVFVDLPSRSLGRCDCLGRGRGSRRTVDERRQRFRGHNDSNMECGHGLVRSRANGSQRYDFERDLFGLRRGELKPGLSNTNMGQKDGRVLSQTGTGKKRSHAQNSLLPSPEITCRITSVGAFSCFQILA